MDSAPAENTSLTWRGSFLDPDLELACQKKVWTRHLGQTKAVFLCTALAYFSAAHADYLHLGPGESFNILFALRLAVLLLGLSSFLVLNKNNCLPWAGRLMTVYTTLVAGSELVELAVKLGPTGEEGAAFTTVIILMFYLFLPIRVISPAIVGLLTMAAYTALLFLAGTYRAEYVMVTLLMMLLANAMGISFNYRYSRIQHNEYRALMEERRTNEKLRLEVAERCRMEAKLRKLATTDELTGLLNRRHFMDLCREEERRSRRYGHPLSILMIDVDGFKAVNDSLGHDTGDKVLEALARVLPEHLRASDFIGRLGGEEFAALLPETPLDQALEAARRLGRAVMDMRVEIDSEQVSVTVSVGVAQMGSDTPDLRSLLKKADQMLYQAKSLGRNRACCADDASHPFQA